MTRFFHVTLQFFEFEVIQDLKLICYKSTGCISVTSSSTVTALLVCDICRPLLEVVRGSSPTVKEGVDQRRDAPSLTVGLLPRTFVTAAI